MKKYLITFLVIIISVCSVYALDYFGVIDLPIGSAKVTVEIFVQNAQTGEYEKNEITVRVKSNSEYTYTPLSKQYYDLDLQNSLLQTQNATNETVLKVYYVCQTCEVTFVGGEGANLVDGKERVTVRKGEIPTPPTYYKRGYEVSGYDKELGAVFEDSTFTANWVVANYTLTLNVVSGTTVNDSNYLLSPDFKNCYQKTFTYFDEEFELPTASCYGYIFMGWYEEPNGQGKKYQSIESGSEGNLTLYSHFNVITYEIKFVSPINGYSFQSIIESENARVYPPVIPAKYQIPGSGLNWYTDSEFTNLYTFDLMPKNGITLYGKWEVDTGVGIWGDYNFQSANSTIDSEKEFVLYLDYVTYNYVTEDKSIVKDITFATKSEIEQNMGKYVALTEYFGTFPVNYSISEGQKSGVKSTIRVFVDADVMQKEGSLTTERNDYTPYYYPDYHYTGRENHSTFYVDGLLYSQNVESSNQLVYALEHGFKPVCKNGSSAEAVYQKARETLNSIIEENFTDYQKALAIFEYLALNVQYDNNAVTITNSGDKREWGKYDAFYLEGVFNNQKAVCDGISKAFSVMCNIEGIPCVQVTGNGHAWCKVKINNRWTIVDPTHGNTLIEANKRGVLAHEHFMMTEDAKKSIGYSSELYSNIVADYSVNYFELKTFSTLIGASNFVANGKEDIVLILNYYRQLFNSGSFLIDFCYTGNNFEKDLRDAITIVGYSGNIRSSTFNSVYGKIVKLLF